jgi:hypothetical protein
MTTLFLVYEYLKIEKIEQYTKNLAQETETAKSFDSLLRASSNINGDSEKANGYFIKRDEVVNFLDAIESLGSTTNTQISIKSVDDKKNASSSSLLSVNLIASGSYSNLYYLVRLLEEFPYQLEIQKIQLVKGVPNWTADINIIGVMF